MSTAPDTTLYESIQLTEVDHASPPPLPPSPEPARSPQPGFLDSFLQERNIKWVLGVGTAIVLGSSLMLVVNHWQHYTPIWKQLIMLSYTALIACAGWWSYHKLALQKTGTTLMSLTALLMPVMFLGMHWVNATAAALDAPAISGALTRDGPFSSLMLPSLPQFAILAATILFAYLAASRIFRHFLRGNQRTFLLAYLTLCVAGVILPLIPASFAPISALALWLIASAGAIKVNRHVFWLVEEHRAPRTLGFIPILLLAAQFLVLYTLHLAPHIALPWFGLGCVLASATVLITTDTLARVFQQRTGDLVRPLPIAIVVPLVIGLVLTALGVILAATDFYPDLKAHALVPTAAVAAILMFLVARRTSHPAFAWAGLIALTLAYQTSPAFFADFARQLLQHGAELIREQRLPVAFYGLTYLPLILGFMFTAAFARKRGYALLAKPAQHYSAFLCAVLLLLSTNHVKATAPVALAMTIVFALQTRLFRDARLAIPAVIAFLLAALSATSFIEVTIGTKLLATTTGDLRTIFMLAAAGLLLIPGTGIDRAVQALGAGDAPRSTFAPCRTASLFTTAVLAMKWTLLHALPALDGGLAFDPIWLATGVGIAILLAAHATLMRNQALAYVTLGFAYALGLVAALSLGVGTITILSLAVFILIAQWFVAELAKGNQRMSLAAAFAGPAAHASHAALSLALIVIAIGGSGIEMFTNTPLTSDAISWAARIAIIGWALIAAVRSLNQQLAAVGYIAGLVTAASAFILLGGELNWLPVLFAGLAAGTLPITRIIRVLHERTAALTEPVEERPAGAAPTTIPLITRLFLTVVHPVEAVTIAVLGLIAVPSLAVYTLPMRIAGFTALGGLIALGFRRGSHASRTICFTLVNWQLIALAVVAFAPVGLTTILDLSAESTRTIMFPVALMAAFSVLIWQQVKPSAHALTNLIVDHHRGLMGVLAAIALIITAYYRDVAAPEFVAAALVFLIGTLAQLRAACRDRSEIGVYRAALIAGLGVLYFFHHGVIGFAYGLSMYALLAASGALSLAARAADRHEFTRIITRPFRQIALVLPLIAVGTGVLRHFSMPDTTWTGINSLAILLAAAFYFWQGVATRERGFIILAAAILNVALALLWRELTFTDPQFFMIPLGISLLGIVRLMRKEIPGDVREPLNYLGALVILVSPVFNIVGSGSWVHLLSLMVLSVGVILAAIGFRVRPMVYAGSAFLVADLIAMVAIGSVDQPSLLWIAGIGVGAAVVTLGAFAERNREQLLTRVRLVSATLAGWD